MRESSSRKSSCPVHSLGYRINVLYFQSTERKAILTKVYQSMPRILGPPNKDFPLDRFSFIYTWLYSSYQDIYFHRRKGKVSVPRVFFKNQNPWLMSFYINRNNSWASKFSNVYLVSCSVYNKSIYGTWLISDCTLNRIS